jgi:hypothetical protein
MAGYLITHDSETQASEAGAPLPPRIQVVYFAEFLAIYDSFAKGWIRDPMS